MQTSTHTDLGWDSNPPALEVCSYSATRCAGPLVSACMKVGMWDMHSAGSLLPLLAKAN